MARSHREPSTATIKLLYATADHCAKPGCSEPLYKTVAGESRPRLNSRVCHIRARSEGGARWDSTQNEEDNRAPENLVLLCIEHASEIDEPALVSRYPVSLLLAWRTEQVKGARVGRQLSDEEADEVARLSFLSQPISFQHSVIHLGGEGGRAPGSGGGGGGAIGWGATGGRGGDVATRFHCNGLDATQPGAGGGGAGTSPPTRRIDWTAADVGPVPQDAPLARPAAGQLRLTSLFFAGSAHGFGGLLYVWAGNWEHFEVAKLPCELAPALVVMLHADGLAPALTIRLTAIVRDPDGKRVLEQEFLVETTSERPVVLMNALVTLRFNATRVGIWSVFVNEGSKELGWIPLEVRTAPSQAGAP